MTATQARPDLDAIDHPLDADPIMIQEPPAPTKPAPKPERPSATRRAVGVLIWFVAGFALWCVFLSALSYIGTQKSLDQRLRSDLSQGLTPVNQPVAAGTPVARLQIRAIGLDATVVEGSEARQLVAGPGHLRTSTFPGQAGVSVVLGRTVTNGAPFRHLGELRRGQRIRVTNGQGTWSYRVERVRTYPADDARAFVATGNRLLLVGAERTLFSPGRVVVTARAVGGLAQPGTRSQLGPATAAELGLQGDATAATGLLVWLQILVLASVGAVVLHRRWGAWPAWLLAVPVVGAALWSLYSFMALLLPAAF